MFVFVDATYEKYDVTITTLATKMYILKDIPKFKIDSKLENQHAPLCCYLFNRVNFNALEKFYKATASGLIDKSLTE